MHQEGVLEFATFGKEISFADRRSRDQVQSCAGVCNPFLDADVNGSRIGGGTSATGRTGHQVWVVLNEALYICIIRVGKFFWCNVADDGPSACATVLCLLIRANGRRLVSIEKMTERDFGPFHLGLPVWVVPSNLGTAGSRGLIISE